MITISERGVNCPPGGKAPSFPTYNKVLQVDRFPILGEKNGGGRSLETMSLGLSELHTRACITIMRRSLGSTAGGAPPFILLSLSRAFRKRTGKEITE